MASPLPKSMGAAFPTIPTQIKHKISDKWVVEHLAFDSFDEDLVGDMGGAESSRKLTYIHWLNLDDDPAYFKHSTDLRCLDPLHCTVALIDHQLHRDIEAVLFAVCCCRVHCDKSDGVQSKRWQKLWSEYRVPGTLILVLCLLRVKDNCYRASICEGGLGSCNSVCLSICHTRGLWQN